MTLFTLKYIPQHSTQIIGQQKAMQELKDYVLHFKQKRGKAALLHGPIGTGKTSSVYALAKELGYDVLEMNSSDTRNEESMNAFLKPALGQQSLFFRPKMILIDEVDTISGVRDRGCLPTLVAAIETAQFPVIVTGNDVSDSKFKALQKVSYNIEFEKVQHTLIASFLRNICLKEGITFEEKALNSLARQVDGDIRSALIDLQISSLHNQCTFERVSQLSDRKRTESLLNVLSIIFKSSSAENVLSIFDNVDMEMEEIMLWIDENVPKEYLSARSLSKAYESLARADVFQGRIMRRQHWRFLAYINDLLSAGISSAKEEKNSQFISYKPTMRFLQLWQAKQRNARKKEIAVKIAPLLHVSQKRALGYMPYLQILAKKGNNEVLTQELALTEEELEWLQR